MLTNKIRLQPRKALGELKKWQNVFNEFTADIDKSQSAEIYKGKFILLDWRKQNLVENDSQLTKELPEVSEMCYYFKDIARFLNVC